MMSSRYELLGFWTMPTNAPIAPNPLAAYKDAALAVAYRANAKLGASSRGAASGNPCALAATTTGVSTNRPRIPP